MARGNAPFGDIFMVNTPNIDQLGQHLYQQELLKKQQQAKDNDLLDNEFSRNLTGIRDADIPDLTKAYGEFKQARMGTLNKRNISPDEQLDVLRKKANVYDIINQSKTNKDWETAQGKQIMTDKKGLYADDAHQQLISRMRTPVTKIDTNNDSNLLYKYSMPDLNKELKIAKGDQKEVPILLGQNPIDKFKDDKEIYKVGNNPNQFYNSLLQGVVAGNKGRNFTGIVNQKYNDQELEDLRTKYYAKINDPKFVQIYGKPEPFPESANNTDLGKAVAIETMENVVNTPLAPIKKISEINQERKIADAQRYGMNKMGVNDAYIRGRMRTAQGYKEALVDYRADKSAAENEGVLNKVINTSYEGGTNRIGGATVDHLTIDGKNYKGKFIDVLSNVKDEYAHPLTTDKSTGKVTSWKYPDGFYLTDDKKTIIPVFLGEKTGTKDNRVIDGALSKPRDIQMYKIPLAKALLTKKDTGSEVTDDDLTGDSDDTENDQQPPPTPSNDLIQVNVNGKVLRGKKSDLKNLDSKGIKYTIIK